MSSGITRRLIFYFTLVITVFAVVMGLIFGLSYQRQTKNTVKFDLQRYSAQIVAMVEEAQSFEGHQNHVTDLLESSSLQNVQVWVVDTTGKIYRLTSIKMGMGMMHDISNLNNTTRALIGAVLRGQEVSTDNVRGVFDREVLTVGTPIHNDSSIVGGLFISASADDIKQHVQRSAEEGQISKFAIPEQVRFVDNLARTSVGKLNKKAIREELA